MAGISTDAVITILKSSFGVWRKSLDAVKTALAALFILDIVLLLVQILIFGTEADVNGTTMLYNLPYVASAIVVGIIASIIGLSIVKPIYAVLRNSEPENWLNLAGGQAINLIKIVAANIAFFVPTILAFVIFFAAAFLWPVLGVVVMIIAILVLVVQALVLAFMSPFIQQQIVIEGNGPIQALKESYALAKENVVPIILYSIGSGLIAVAVYIPVFIGMMAVSMLFGVVGGEIVAALAASILSSLFSVFFYTPWSTGLEVAFWAEAKRVRAPAQ